MTDIRDQYVYEIDVYPKTLPVAHDILEDYMRKRKLFPTKKKPKNGKGKLKDPKKEDVEKELDTGVIYSQDDIVSGTNKKLHS